MKCMRKGQRVTCMAWFFPLTTWSLGLELRFSSWAALPLSHSIRLLLTLKLVWANYVLPGYRLYCLISFPLPVPTSSFSLHPMRPVLHSADSSHPQVLVSPTLQDGCSSPTNLHVPLHVLTLQTHVTDQPLFISQGHTKAPTVTTTRWIFWFMRKAERLTTITYSWSL